MWMFSADHPQQTTEPGMLKVGHVVGQHRMGFPTHYIQPRRVTLDLRQLSRDAHHLPHIHLTPQAGLLIRVVLRTH